MAIGDNLKRLRIAAGLTQVELGKKIQRSGQVISNWERGYTNDIVSKDLEKLASALGVSTEYLFNIHAKSQQETITNAREALADLERKESLYNVKKVPIVGTIACGRPILATENIQGFAYTNDPAADFVLVAKGDSMEGKRIHDGDLVFIHQQEDVENGEVAAVLIDGEATLKIVHHGEGVVILSPANDKYSPKVFHEGDVESFRILGKAVKVQIDFK